MYVCIHIYTLICLDLFIYINIIYAHTLFRKDAHSGLDLISLRPLWKQQRLAYFGLAFSQVHQADEAWLPSLMHSFVGYGSLREPCPSAENMQSDAT